MSEAMSEAASGACLCTVQGPHKGHTQGGAGATNNQLTNNQQPTRSQKKRRWPAPSSELRALREGALSPIPQFPISQPRGVSSALAGRATSDEHELLLTRTATSNATLPPFTFTFFFSVSTLYLGQELHSTLYSSVEDPVGIKDVHISGTRARPPAQLLDEFCGGVWEKNKKMRKGQFLRSR